MQPRASRRPIRRSSSRIARLVPAPPTADDYHPPRLTEAQKSRQPGERLSTQPSFLPGRRLNWLEGKCTYENTIENIGLVLKGHHRSPAVAPGQSASQQRCRSRSPTVTRGRSRIALDNGSERTTDQKVGGSNPSERANRIWPLTCGDNLRKPPHQRGLLSFPTPMYQVMYQAGGSVSDAYRRYRVVISGGVSSPVAPPHQSVPTFWKPGLP
jgi:hypothetical protein